MNLNPLAWLSGRKSNDVGSSALVRSSMSMGPWQGAIGQGFIPREVNPWFLEALRSSLGVLDGAINRLVTVDGIIDVEGGNDALVQLIQSELIASIPVGDLQGGLQAFYASQGGEVYEQGFTVGEMVFDRRGRELIGLRVADSKGVLFHRNTDTGQMETWYLPPIPRVVGRRDGTDSVQTVLRNSPQQLNASVIQGKGYTQLNPETLIYSAFNPENDGPYGVSLMRGIEFVSQILLRMHNAQSQAWDRFGDPIFHINYKTKNRALKDAALESRRAKLANDLATAINAKRGGNSADFTTAVGADDDITVSIVGGDGKVLSIEMPARHMLEQILGKVGLPAWMLGIQLGTAERMADNQAEVVLQESKTRFEARLPGLDRLVATWLRGRGKTWKPGDWKLVQRLPNLRDELKRAQAGFLNAQTALMLRNGGVTLPSDNTDPQSDDAPTKASRKQLNDLFAETTASLVGDGFVVKALTSRCTPRAKVARKAASEQWAIDDPNLPRIQKAAVSALGSAWNKLRDDTLAALKLPTTKAAAETFQFDVMTMLKKLTDLQAEFIATNTSPDSALVQLALEVWVRGIENAASGVDRADEASTIAEQARTRRAAALATDLHSTLQKTTVRVYENDIVHALIDGAYNGDSPDDVAKQLGDQFDTHDYDWERLAESEIAASHAQGQIDGLSGMGIAQYDWILAPEACKVCTRIAEEGPYAVGVGPMPVRDSHPGCLCVLAGHI